MTTNKIKYSQKLGGMSASLTVFLCTTIIFLRAESISMSLLLYALSIIVPAGLITGYLGFKTGQIFDSTKKKKSLKNLIK